MTVNELIQMLCEIIIDNPKQANTPVFQDSGSCIQSWTIDEDGDIILTTGGN